MLSSLKDDVLLLPSRCLVRMARGAGGVLFSLGFLPIPTVGFWRFTHMYS
jgi:hypothetical protein